MTEARRATTILWINGAHGVGKSTVARAILRFRPEALLFDPEIVGHAIRKLWPRPQPRDFKDMPVWSEVVAQALRALVRDVGPPFVIVPMTVVDAGQLELMLSAPRQTGAQVRHVTLIAADATRAARLHWRIAWPGSRRWAREYGALASGLLIGAAFAPHVATDGRTPRDIAMELISLCST